MNKCIATVHYLGVDLGDCFARFVFSLLTTSQSRPLGIEFSWATEIHYYLPSRKGSSGGNYSVLYYVACTRLSCLLDTIASTFNCNLIQMNIRLIKEASEWSEYNLIIKSKGKGSRFISTIAQLLLTSTNSTSTKLLSLSLSLSLSLQRISDENQLSTVSAIIVFLLRESTT